MTNWKLPEFTTIISSRISVLWSWRSTLDGLFNFLIHVKLLPHSAQTISAWGLTSYYSLLFSAPVYHQPSSASEQSIAQVAVHMQYQLASILVSVFQLCTRGIPYCTLSWNVFLKQCTPHLLPYIVARLPLSVHYIASCIFQIGLSLLCSKICSLCFLVFPQFLPIMLILCFLWGELRMLTF